MAAEENDQEAVSEIDRLLAIDLNEKTQKLEWVKKHRSWLQEEREKITSLL